MGNKVSHKETREVHSKVSLKKSKLPSGSKNSKKFNSENPLVTHDPAGGEMNLQQNNRNVTKVEVKIFRSYTNLNEFGTKKLITNDKPTNIRVYKKSSQKVVPGTLQHDNDVEILRPVSRSYSLPRSFGKSKSLRSSTVSISSNENTNSLRDKRLYRSCTPSKLSLSDRSSSAYRVKKMDFVETEVLEGRLQIFKENLVKAILTRLTSFSLSFQTSIIPIVLFPPNENSLGPHSLLTLKCYLEDDSDPSFDPVQANLDGLCALFVSRSSLQGIQFLKENPSEEHISHFTQLVFFSVCQEISGDLAGMYEYQIGLLSSDVSIRILSNCMADRMISYITRDMKVPLVDRNSLLFGALKGRTEVDNLPPAVVSVILGMKELKWNLYDILDKPGVRRDILFDKEHLNDLDGPDRSPFKFFSSSSSDHMTYGYRGQMLELDFSKGIYKQSVIELDEFSDEVLWRYDDFHRLYPPYYRVVGDKVFKRFATCLKSNMNQVSELNDLAKKIMDGIQYSRDTIETLFKPSSRMGLPDKLIRIANPDLVERVPESLLNRINTLMFHCASPILSTDFPICESDLLCDVLTSTPNFEEQKNKSNKFPNFGKVISNELQVPLQNGHNFM